MWAVRVDGVPRPKGSMKCVGTGGRHQLVPDQGKGDRKASYAAWTRAATNAGVALHDHIGDTLDGPISVELTFTVPAPAAARRRPWPHTRCAGDVDKLTRLVLDCLTIAEVWGDDSQVVEATVRKCYPHTTAPDVGQVPGVLIRVWRTEE